MSIPDDLLEQSRHLANREPRRPRQASLRRAISTAYYSLFHLLINAAVSNGRSARHRDLLARAFQHRNRRTACAETSKLMSRSQDLSAVHLGRIADAFVLLQEDRQTADYDNSKTWTRSEVLDRIEIAGAAFESWNVIVGESISEDFLLQLLIQR